MKDLNLIPSNILVEEKNKNVRKQIDLIIILAVIVLFVVIAWPLLNYYNLNEEKERLENQKNSMLQAQAKAESISKAMVELDKKEEIVDDIEKVQSIYRDLLARLESKMPKRVCTVTLGLTDNGQTITISGGAVDEIAVADFLRSVRAIDGMNGIKITSISSGNSQGSSKSVKNFQVSLKYQQRSK